MPEYPRQFRVAEQNYRDTHVFCCEQAENQGYADRSQVENTINVCKDGGLGQERARDRAMAKAHVFLSLCLQLVVAITNYEREGDPNSPNLAL